MLFDLNTVEELICIFNHISLCMHCIKVAVTGSTNNWQKLCVEPEVQYVELMAICPVFSTATQDAIRMKKLDVLMCDDFDILFPGK